MKNILIYGIIIVVTCSFSLKATTLKSVPSFHSCSIYYDNEKLATGNQLRYRDIQSKDWQISHPLLNSANNKTWRTSLMNLKEATSYEVELLDSKGAILAKTQFKTQTLNVPISLEKQVPTQGPITINEKGKTDAWIRYKANAAICGNKDSESAILIENAEYIIIENMKLTGGQRHAIHIKNSKNIRIINCNISAWGRTGIRDYNRSGLIIDKRKQPINYDAGIFIDQCENILVERCYFHDPNGTAISWLFAHPAGPCAIYMHTKSNTVIRYNDFIGSDQHRWNDVIEGKFNGFPHGGFCSDADIYGNLLIYGNDDGVELDGGQMNIRVWGNHFEGTLCGISTAPCIFGPTFAYNNLFVNPGDIDNVKGSAFKNGHRLCGQGQIFLKNNTAIWANGMNSFGKSQKAPRRYMNTRNNVFSVIRNVAYKSLIMEKNNLDYDMIWAKDKTYYNQLKTMLKEYGVEKNAIFAKPVFQDPEKGDYRLKPGTTCYGKHGIQAMLPIRPTTLKLDRKHIDFKLNKNPITVTASTNQAMPFKIMKNNVFDWFKVTPKSGTFPPNKPITFKVTTIPNLPAGRLKGAFIIKLDNGFSRPVIVYAGKKQPIKLTSSTPGGAALIDIRKPDHPSPFNLVKTDGSTNGKAMYLPFNKDTNLLERKTVSYTFTVNKEDWYYPAVRFKPTSTGGLCSMYVSLDGQPFTFTMMRHCDDWTWAGMPIWQKKSKRRGWFRGIKLKPGTHTLTITPNEEFLLDSIAILTTPAVVTRYIK